MEYNSKEYNSAQEIIDDLGKDGVIEALRDDDQYYGGVGTLFLSNSNVGTLVEDPKSFGKTNNTASAAMKIGNFFHKSILEPHKCEGEIIVDATTRNTKVYKEAVAESGEDILLLRKDYDSIISWKNKMLKNPHLNDLIVGEGIEYELPIIGKINDEWWKGKCDIVNHNDKLIIDLKTSGDMSRFRNSAYKYGYNSQAFIYQELHGYEMVFAVIDKNTTNLGLYECSPKFIESGKEKVYEAILAYKLYHKDNPDFDWDTFMDIGTL